MRGAGQKERSSSYRKHTHLVPFIQSNTHFHEDVSIAKFSQVMRMRGRGQGQLTSEGKALLIAKVNKEPKKKEARADAVAQNVQTWPFSKIRELCTPLLCCSK